MSKVPKEYRELLKNALKEEKAKTESPERPFKRAKRLQTPVQRARELRNKPPPKKEEHERYVIHLDDDDEDGDDNDKLQKRKASGTQTKSAKSVEQEIISIGDEETNEKNTSVEVESEEDEDINSDDFEDVDLDEISILNNADDEDGDINVTIRQHRGKRKVSQRATVVSKEERIFRRVMHLMYLFMMVGHGVSRNVWLSDPKLLMAIQKQIPGNLKTELKQYQEHRIKTNVTSQSKTRKLLDFLRHLMEYWQNVWTIDFKAPILYKKTWTELKFPQLLHNRKKQKMNKLKFKNMLLTHTGSRDIAAQGFVALLRSLNLPARLVFSIQPPDFTNMKKCDEDVIKNDEDKSKSESKSKSFNTNTTNKKVKSGDRILAILRSKKAYTNTSTKTTAEKDDEFSEKYGSWPVFWVEVWDKDSKKYITIDPIVQKIIEVINWKSKLEPPMNSIRNNAWYVVGYDRVGGVRDITRRYAKEYNSKVRKKRITREPKWENWWIALLKGACSKKRIKENRVDKFEQIEFEELELKEGMPANIADFKGHPVYVLEKDLKFNEILMPKISCGGLSKKGKVTKGKEGFIPVYKRSNVHIVRSARGWFMRGRVLKVGERPLKIRPKNTNKKRGKRGTEDEFQLSDNDADDNDDGEDGRLYAESQTTLYVPPPVVDGKIPKNAFKNIDVYEPWMIPAGCVHIRDKLAEKAAKLMGIEYAPAVVGFDFSGSRRDASAKIEGIVTFAEYEEAVRLICQGLYDMEEDEKRMKEDLINLRAWRILLTKLKISKRLLHEHGEVEDSDKEEIDASDNDNTTSEEEFESGGFMLGNRGPVETASSRTRSHYTTDNHSGLETLNGQMEDADLSASDFDSDLADINGDGDFNIQQVTQIKKRGERKKKIDEIKPGKQEKSMLSSASGLDMDDGELVYDPNGDDKMMDYSDSDDDSDNDVSGDKEGEGIGADDPRMQQLDAEFADFMGDMKEKISEETNKEDVGDSIASHGNDEQNSTQESSKNKEMEDNEDYEFEYSD